MSTNDDKPFEKGEIIQFSGDRYEVLENYGRSGRVKALSDGGITVDNFWWIFEEELCVRE